MFPEYFRERLEDDLFSWLDYVLYGDGFNADFIKEDYIDAGIVFTDIIKITAMDLQIISSDDMEIIDNLMMNMPNVEYRDNHLFREFWIRAGVPCITSLERQN